MSYAEIPWLHWFEDPSKLAELWRWLAEAGDEPDDPAYFMEEPWKWQREWDSYQRINHTEAA